jgi:hypothetical protein
MAPRTGPPAIHPGMSEDDVDYHVRAWCRDLGLKAFHHLDSRGTASGFPDWVIIGPGGILWREGKGVRGRVSPAQTEVIALLRARGQDARVWWPSDLVDGTARAELLAVSWMADRLATT